MKCHKMKKNKNQINVKHRIIYVEGELILSKLASPNENAVVMKVLINIYHFEAEK